MDNSGLLEATNKKFYCLLTIRMFTARFEFAIECNNMATIQIVINSKTNFVMYCYNFLLLHRRFALSSHVMALLLLQEINGPQREADHITSNCTEDLQQYVIAEGCLVLFLATAVRQSFSSCGPRK